jgi:hypothetical protein
MLHKAVRLVAFYNRKELHFSYLEQLLAQTFAAFLALTAAAIWPRLLAVPAGLYLALAVAFAAWPLTVKLRQLRAKRNRPFMVREQKLTQLTAACLALALASVVPQVRALNFYLIVALTLVFALRPVYLLYIDRERWAVRTVGFGLLAAYVVLALSLHNLVPR